MWRRQLKAASVIGSSFGDVVYKYTDRDVILYALAIGFSTKQRNRSLNLLYEGHKKFSPFPTFTLTSAMAVLRDTILTGDVNGFEVDPKMMVLGEQYFELLRPVPRSGALVSRGYVADVVDKGKSGVAIVTNVDTFDLETRIRHAFTQTILFVRNHGDGLDGTKKSSGAIRPLVQPPNRAPDVSVEETTGVDQIALFRLTGYRDQNPLHIDPNFSRAAGYRLPLVHGVGLVGFVARQALESFCDGDLGQFGAIKARISSPVYPGDTLRYDMWRGERTDSPFSSTQRIHVQTTNLSTGSVCVTGAYVDLHTTEMDAPRPARL